MKFRVLINRWANSYYFLHNFSQCEWPWPYRPSGPITIWEKRFGKFSREERVTLKRFKKIYHRYFLKFYLGKPFFEEKNPWKALKKKISPKDIKELEKIFSVFEKKFEIIFFEKEAFLKEWSTKLAASVKHQPSKNIIKSLNSLFRADLNHRTFNIFLLLGNAKENSFKKYAAGAGGERGRGLKEGNILLEMHMKCPFKKVDYITGVILHEITHHYIQDDIFLQKILASIFKKKQAVSFLNEVIIRALLPIGILSVRFLNAPRPLSLNPFSKSALPEIDSGQTEEIIKLTDSYIQKKKKFDRIYIKEFIKILSRQKKWTTLLSK